MYLCISLFVIPEELYVGSRGIDAEKVKVCDLETVCGEMKLMFFIFYYQLFCQLFSRLIDYQLFCQLFSRLIDIFVFKMSGT